jgi:hypothetical protein
MSSKSTSSADKTPDLPVTFNWAKARFPAFAHSTGFFLYAAIILFFCFGLIPNFLPVPDWVFRSCMVALILVIDRLCNKLFLGYTLQGKVEVGEQDIRLVSQRGRTEHILKHSDIYRVHVLEGIPMSLFTALSEHRTVVVEIVFRDKRTMKFEVTKWANQPQEKWHFEKCIDAVRATY